MGQIETNRWRGIERCCRVVVKGRVRGTQEEYKTSQNSHQLCSLCRQVCLSSSVHRHWQQPRHHRCSFVRRVHHSLGKSPDNDCRLSASLFLCHWREGPHEISRVLAALARSSMPKATTIKILAPRRGWLCSFSPQERTRCGILGASILVLHLLSPSVSEEEREPH